jgi:hypothetical protein
MLYLKAAAVGVISGLLFVCAWIFATVLLPLILMSRNESGIGAVAGGTASPVLAGAVGFLVGFYWVIRRARRPAESKSN